MSEPRDDRESERDIPLTDDEAHEPEPIEILGEFTVRPIRGGDVTIEGDES